MTILAHFLRLTRHVRTSRSIQLLILASSFSILLSISRVAYTGSGLYLFLIWNLFLAAIPWGISRYLRAADLSDKQISLAKVWSLRLIWLLFLPNAPYIITDLYHLRWSNGHLIWYDALLIFSFAWTGLLFGLLSLRDMESHLSRRFGRLRTRILVPIILFATAFGIYIGRYQRWNSWDILRQPQALFLDIADILLHPLSHPRAWALTILMGLFLNLLYASLSMLRAEGSEATPTHVSVLENS